LGGIEFYNLTTEMKILLTIILSIIFSTSYSQNILDLGLKLSESMNIPTDSAKFRSAINHFNTNTKSSDIFDFRITLVDLKNGYLEGSIPDNEISICYWDMTNGKKLICYNNWAYGPVCSSNWRFYEYSKDNGIQKSKQKIKPEDFIKDNDYFDFEQMRKENNDSDFERLKSEAYLSFSLSLPRYGQNVNLYFDPNVNDIWVTEKLRYKVKYKGVELIWKDGNFMKGEWIIK